jgi:RNA polymerase sigma-70 factor (ECF subfamily)
VEPPSATPKPPPCADPNRWFAEEVHAHDGQLKSYLKGTFPSVRDVEDVVQESYLRIWKAHAAHPIASAKSFLFTIARNLARNVIRKEANSPLIFAGDEAVSSVLNDEPHVADRLTREEKGLLLAKAIVALPPKTLAIILMHKFDGLPQAEIAARLGISVRTVEFHVGQAVRRVTEFFRKQGHEYF